MTPFFVPVEALGSSDGYFPGGDPERLLREIMTFAYEAALDAGLSREKTFAIIEQWLESEQLELRNLAPFSGCAISSEV